MVMAAVMMAGVGAAGAQIVDPSTGFTVDAATDPTDFVDVVTGQPGNPAMEASMNAIAQMQAANDAAVAQSQQDAANPTTQVDDDDTPVMPALPSTPKPAISPKGGTFHGSVQVSITDSDAAAAVFYTTDGTKPTTSSARYNGPITVSAKEKVQALAFDVNSRPSGVVSKTFKVKA
jgi:hypothetical protein